MLVLSRKMMESLYLITEDEDGNKTKIKIQVVGTGKMVRLGIEAAPNVTILREELLPKDEQQKVITKVAVPKPLVAS